MNEKLEEIKSQYKSMTEISDIKDNPVTKALISVAKVAPVIGDLIDESVDSMISSFQEKKEKELIDCIISDSSHTISTAQINDVEFIINFVKVIDAVRRLSTNDKVKFFGNLIRNGYLSEEKIESSLFDEYFEILSTLSYREIQYLTAYKQYLDGRNEERKKKRQEPINGGFTRFSRVFSEEIGEDERSIWNIFSRLVRTGFVGEDFDTGPKPGASEDYSAADLVAFVSDYYLTKEFLQFYDTVLKIDCEQNK